MLLARHRMSGKESATCGFAEDLLRPLSNFGLRASSVCDEAIGRQDRSDLFDQVDDGSNRRGQHHQLAAFA